MAVMIESPDWIDLAAWTSQMGDQIKTDPVMHSEKGDTPQSAHCLSTTTTETDSQERHVDVTRMIRSLQRTEGLADCFRRGMADCDQLDCAWRQYCLEGHDNLRPDNDP